MSGVRSSESNPYATGSSVQGALRWLIRSYALVLLAMFAYMLWKCADELLHPGVASESASPIEVISDAAPNIAAAVGVAGALGMVFLRAWGRSVLIVSHVIACLYVLLLTVQAGPLVILMVAYTFAAIETDPPVGILFLAQVITWSASFALLYPAAVRDELS